MWGHTWAAPNRILGRAGLTPGPSRGGRCSRRGGRPRMAHNCQPPSGRAPARGEAARGRRSEGPALGRRQRPAASSKSDPPAARQHRQPFLPQQHKHALPRATRPSPAAPTSVQCIADRAHPLPLLPLTAPFHCARRAHSQHPSRASQPSSKLSGGGGGGGVGGGEMQVGAPHRLRPPEQAFSRTGP